MSQKPSISPTKNFSDLVSIVQTLRKECPWDREQSHESLKDLMVEEVYEAIDAIDKKDFDELKKELGDLLLHIVFHAEMAQETQNFNIEDVIFAIQDKLIRRHPHVYAQTKVSGTKEVLKNWEQLKLQEKERKSVLSGVPRHLPGLLRAERMQEKAAAVGFDWPEYQQAWEKLEEELQEFKQVLDSGQKEEQEKEFGDVLFSIVNTARYFGLHPEDCLRLTNNKFQARFEFIERELEKKGSSPSTSTLEEMDTLWNLAKTRAQND